MLAKLNYELGTFYLLLVSTHVATDKIKKIDKWQRQ